MKIKIKIIALAFVLGAAIVHAQEPTKRMWSKEEYARQMSIHREKFEAAKRQLNENAWMRFVRVYPNNVYYFACGDMDFPDTLSKFLDKYTELEVVSMAANIRRANRLGSTSNAETADYGTTVGYTVVMRFKRAAATE